MPPKHVSPSIRETAFSCPHCGALTTQYWYVVSTDIIKSKSKLPFLMTDDRVLELVNDDGIPDDIKEELSEDYNRQLNGETYIEDMYEERHTYNDVVNLHISKCFNCHYIALWIFDKMIYPDGKLEIEPNIDLPDDILNDYNEARVIVNYSPRGSSALLRLCVQKLCIYLGEKGKNINNDIESLVKKGLNPLVQKSLDIVRVVGNEAVHPGKMDMKDDRDTAIKLFRLVNVIAEQLITIPKHIEETYTSVLPEEKRKAIEERDKNKGSGRPRAYPTRGRD